MNKQTFSNNIKDFSKLGKLELKDVEQAVQTYSYNNLLPIIYAKKLQAENKLTQHKLSKIAALIPDREKLFQLLNEVDVPSAQSSAKTKSKPIAKAKTSSKIVKSDTSVSKKQKVTISKKTKVVSKSKATSKPNNSSKSTSQATNKTTPKDSIPKNRVSKSVKPKATPKKLAKKIIKNREEPVKKPTMKKAVSNTIKKAANKKSTKLNTTNNGRAIAKSNLKTSTSRKRPSSSVAKSSFIEWISEYSSGKTAGSQKLENQYLSEVNIFETTDDDIKGAVEYFNEKSQEKSPTKRRKKPAKTVEEQAASSVIDNKENATETLALIYLNQKQFDRSIAIYKELNLKYPEKKAYFAEQIKKIQQKITNNKST